MPLSSKVPRFAVFMEVTNLVGIKPAGIFTYASLIFLDVVEKAKNVRLSTVSKREITETLNSDWALMHFRTEKSK